jgi:hypothetical protein
MSNNVSGLDAPGAFLPGPITSEDSEKRTATTEEAPEDICDDNQDNDGDGMIDLDDPDCVGGKDSEPSDEGGKGDQGDSPAIIGEPSPDDKQICHPNTIYNSKTDKCEEEISG